MNSIGYPSNGLFDFQINGFRGVDFQSETLALAELRFAANLSA